MAHIIISSSEQDQAAVLEVLKELKGEATPVSTIARKAGLKDSTARYALMDLVDSGKVERVVKKAFNKHYIRYGYNVL